MERYILSHSANPTTNHKVTRPFSSFPFLSYVEKSRFYWDGRIRVKVMSEKMRTFYTPIE